MQEPFRDLAMEEWNSKVSMQRTLRICTYTPTCVPEPAFDAVAKSKLGVRWLTALSCRRHLLFLFGALGSWSDRYRMTSTWLIGEVCLRLAIRRHELKFCQRRTNFEYTVQSAEMKEKKCLPCWKFSYEFSWPIKPCCADVYAALMLSRFEYQ